MYIGFVYFIHRLVSYFSSLYIYWYPLYILYITIAILYFYTFAPLLTGHSFTVPYRFFFFIKLLTPQGKIIGLLFMSLSSEFTPGNINGFVSQSSTTNMSIAILPYALCSRSMKTKPISTIISPIFHIGSFICVF